MDTLKDVIHKALFELPNCGDIEDATDAFMAALRAHFAQPGAVTDEVRPIAVGMARLDLKRLLASPEYLDKTSPAHQATVDEVQRLFDLIYPEVA